MNTDKYQIFMFGRQKATAKTTEIIKLWLKLKSIVVKKKKKN